MDQCVINQMLLVVIIFLQCFNHVVRCVITDVRLVGGPSSNKGTVELRQDNGTWETTCGVNLNINDVIVICRQLGFTGASRAIPSTPYGQSSISTTGLACDGSEADLSECLLFSSPSCTVAGAVSCHGEQYLGCFVDNPSDRVLTGDSLLNDPDMTISYCIQFCNQLVTGDYAYAGVEIGNECFCGEASDNYARLGEVTDANCQIPCLGDSTESCGNVGYIAVFNIHVETPIPSIWSTESMETTFSSLSTNQPETSMGITGDPDTETTPTHQQSSNCSCLGVAVGEGIVILILTAIIIALVVLLNRKSQRDSKQNQNSHDMTLVNTSSLKEKDSSFYHDIQDIKPPDMTSQGDPHYSSRIYDQEDGHPSGNKDTNIKGTGKNADPYTEVI